MQAQAVIESNDLKNKQNSVLPWQIVFIIIGISLVYIFFEITLNFSLVNLYSSSIAEIFLNKQLAAQVHNIEMYGRIISGFGFSLLLFGFLYKRLPLPKFGPLVSRLVKFGLFISLWIFLVLLLRFSVEVLVYQTSEKTKLDAVRSIMFKELYNADQLNFPDLIVLNEASKDPLQKKILTALIPSLARVSPEVNKSIEDKTDEIAVFLLNKREREKFQEKISPTLDKNKKMADEELALYDKYRTEFKESNKLLSNKRAFKEYRNNKLNNVNQLLEKSWNKYDLAVNGIPEYTVKKSQKLLNDYGKLKHIYLKKKCHRKNKAYCLKNVYVPWEKKLRAYEIPIKTPEFWFKTASWWELLKKVVILVPAVFETVACDLVTKDRNRYCGPLAKEFEGLDNRLKQVRIEQLAAQYPFSLTLEKAQYLKQPAVQKQGANQLRKEGIKVSKNWTTAEKTQLTKATKKYLRNRDANIQKTYNVKSIADFDLSKKAIKDRDSFYKTKQMQRRFKKNLGKYYYKGYLPQHSDAKVFLNWQGKQKQSNLNIVKMLTHKAEYGFKPGGMFYQLGIDAVKFSIIPTVSIILSVLGVLLISIKILTLCFYHTNYWQKVLITFSQKMTEKENSEKSKKNANKIHVRLWVFPLIVIATIIIVIPIINGFYIERISKSLNQSNRVSSPVNTAKNYGLGYVLDAQSTLFQIAGALDFDVLDAIPKSYLTSIKSIDNYLFDQLNPYAHYVTNFLGLSIDEINEPDINLTIYRKQYDLLLAMGLSIDNQEITKVSIPTMFTNKEADLLFDSKILYGATDYKLLFQTSLLEAKDPEFWVSVMHSDLLRKSMRQQLELKTLAYIKQKYPKGLSSLKFIPKGKKSGNIILVKLNRKKYDCYYLPTFNFSNLITIFSSTDLNTANEKFRCKWEI